MIQKFLIALPLLILSSAPVHADSIRYQIQAVIKPNRTPESVEGLGKQCRRHADRLRSATVKLLKPDGSTACTAFSAKVGSQHYLFSAEHCLDKIGTNTFEAVTHRGGQLTVSPVGRKKLRRRVDVLMLKILSGSPAGALNFGTMADLEPGDVVCQMGHSWEPGWVLRQGVFSNVGIIEARQREEDKHRRGMHFKLDGMATRPGDSGGPVIDGEGRVIGIHIRGAVDEHNRPLPQPEGFAEPISYAKTLALSRVPKIEDDIKAGKKREIETSRRRADAAVSGQKETSKSLYWAAGISAALAAVSGGSALFYYTPEINDIERDLSSRTGPWTNSQLEQASRANTLREDRKIAGLVAGSSMIVSGVLLLLANHADPDDDDSVAIVPYVSGSKAGVFARVDF